MLIFSRLLRENSRITTETGQNGSCCRAFLRKQEFDKYKNVMGLEGHEEFFRSYGTTHDKAGLEPERVLLV